MDDTITKAISTACNAVEEQDFTPDFFDDMPMLEKYRGYVDEESDGSSCCYESINVFEDSEDDEFDEKKKLSKNDNGVFPYQLTVDPTCEKRKLRMEDESLLELAKRFKLNEDHPLLSKEEPDHHQVVMVWTYNLRPRQPRDVARSAQPEEENVPERNQVAVQQNNDRENEVEMNPQEAEDELPMEAEEDEEENSVDSVSRNDNDLSETETDETEVEDQAQEERQVFFRGVNITNMDRDELIQTFNYNTPRTREVFRAIATRQNARQNAEQFRVRMTNERASHVYQVLRNTASDATERQEFLRQYRQIDPMRELNSFYAQRPMARAPTRGIPRRVEQM
jgi:hypothetical protein